MNFTMAYYLFRLRAFLGLMHANRKLVRVLQKTDACNCREGYVCNICRLKQRMNIK